MKRIAKKYLLLFFILLFSVLPEILAASSFIGFGSGITVSNTTSSDGNETGRYIPIIAEYEYAPMYRELLMFNAAVNYLPAINNNEAGNITLFSAGVKYVPRFYFFRSNITESTLKKNSCLGIILLPLTIARDSLTDIAQYGIPSHPFMLLDYTIIKTEEKKYYSGFSAGMGITSGLIDITLNYTQNIRHDSGFQSDIYLAGIELTLHVPLQNKFILEKPLID